MTGASGACIVDRGFYGRADEGTYVGRCMNYIAKYSNGNLPLGLNQSGKVVALKATPGLERYCEKWTGSNSRNTGCDSHIIPAAAEWWMPIPRQTVPWYILTVKAVFRQRQTTGDDS